MTAIGELDHRMPENRRTSYAPWITAGVAGAVLIALVVVYFVVLRPDEGKTVGAFTTSEQDAMTAASIEARNVLSYRRAQFAGDFQRALSGATGPLASDIRNTRSATLNAITSGGFDMSATVVHKALQGAVTSGNKRGYVVLVIIDGFRSNLPNIPRTSQLAVTVQQVKGKWLASDIKSIEVTP
jgi:hypothetical protein